jgi:hypothetical protein
MITEAMRRLSDPVGHVPRRVRETAKSGHIIERFEMMNVEHKACPSVVAFDLSALGHTDLT